MAIGTVMVEHSHTSGETDDDKQIPFVHTSSMDLLF